VILRLQINLEVDTTTKDVQIVGQRVAEGTSAMCLSPGCEKPARPDGYYCSQLCFRTHRPVRAKTQGGCNGYVELV
jgi:hypothetical protein